eukprot:TRINITY_DN19_c0_g1_i12.p1 TRINITY_DN19_c0_g1~~TRINITY_DN19_c0_g1_i12.p1  ORF type:complete len:238 (-),score=84.86 TRINITY_DN19_c0_g1_i12:208-921(-)
MPPTAGAEAVVSTQSTGGLTPCSGHGTCDTSSGLCSCDAFYTGLACEIAHFPCPNNCTPPRGFCDSTIGECVCPYPYYGNDCSNKSCPNDCRNHGTCTTDGICHCFTPYLPPDCFFMSCPLNCSGADHGTCNPFTGVCTCLDMWSGSNCSYLRCPYDCSNSGTCQGGVCNCKMGTKGTGCEKEDPVLIIVIAVVGSAFIVAASVGTFFTVRQYRIHQAKQRRANRGKFSSEMSEAKK